MDVRLGDSLGRWVRFDFSSMLSNLSVKGLVVSGLTQVLSRTSGETTLLATVTFEFNSRAQCIKYEQDVTWMAGGSAPAAAPAAPPANPAGPPAADATAERALLEKSIRGMTVIALKVQLLERELPIDGLKPTLVARLLAHHGLGDVQRKVQLLEAAPADATPAPTPRRATRSRA